MDVRRLLPTLIVLALLVAGGVVVFTDGPEPHRVTAYFPRTVSLYEGSEVKVLGVEVGRVEKITPEGTQVKVEMTYDADVEVPSDARALVIAPAIVGGRYVQLAPAFTDGDDPLPPNAVLEGEGATPVELDDIYANLDRLTVALGPNGANSTGALTDLLEVTARNFGGQGNQFNRTIRNFGRLSETLDDNKDELFGATAELQQFITTLAENDQTVRDFNDSLARVSTLLADERQELAGALSSLATALDEVGGFVQDNREILRTDIRGVNRFVKVLVRQRDALAETLRIAPLALNNLQLAYNPDTGTLDTNANIGNLEREITNDPTAVLCALISGNDPTGRFCEILQSLPLLPRAAALSSSAPRFESTSDPTLGGLVPVTDDATGSTEGGEQ
jgi:phospholipid/cholesterol/gamma-HCH transport system substrate-binding protein